MLVLAFLFSCLSVAVAHMDRDILDLEPFLKTNEPDDASSAVPDESVTESQIKQCVKCLDDLPEDEVTSLNQFAKDCPVDTSARKWKSQCIRLYFDKLEQSPIVHAQCPMCDNILPRVKEELENGKGPSIRKAIKNKFKKWFNKHTEHSEKSGQRQLRLYYYRTYYPLGFLVWFILILLMIGILI